AERFGLAALHQLRGRVGRSSLQSHCFLIYSEKLTEDGKARLKALYESTDGFFIAEEDLRLRGPGEVLGVQQSGYLTLSIADPVRDASIMNVARTEAFEYIRRTHPGC
ncbi:MAG: ATP-dependent DNA helicase RecG, partial [Spirochaetaceae bacterium]|nr:ATP-dependent DNA helicase RecG [Spirochaetaceae bacterium]